MAFCTVRQIKKAPYQISGEELSKRFYKQILFQILKVWKVCHVLKGLYSFSLSLSFFPSLCFLFILSEGKTVVFLKAEPPFSSASWVGILIV